MTLDELRALCMALPGTHEQETLGDAEHAGDITFRVRDRICVMTGPDGRGGASIRTILDQQAERPGAPDDELRSIIEGAWRRTAPKAVVREFDEAHA